MPETSGPGRRADLDPTVPATAPDPSEQSLPPEIQRAVAAANAGDTDLFLSCFAPDGVVDDWGRRFHGREAIRGWSDREFIGVHVSLAVLDVTTAEQTTTVLAQVGGDGFRGRSHFAFDIENQSIALVSITA